MYKCNCCKKVFEEPKEKIERGEVYDEPFGIGKFVTRDIEIAVCPECESEDWEKLSFDGESCLFCGEPIEVENIDYVTQDGRVYEYKCPHCKQEIMVKDGELV